MTNVSRRLSSGVRRVTELFCSMTYVNRGATWTATPQERRAPSPDVTRGLPIVRGLDASSTQSVVLGAAADPPRRAWTPTAGTASTQAWSGPSETRASPPRTSRQPPDCTPGQAHRTPGVLNEEPRKEPTQHQHGQCPRSRAVQPERGQAPRLIQGDRAAQARGWAGSSTHPARRR
jgi:hypothetical protein